MPPVPAEKPSKGRKGQLRPRAKPRDAGAISEELRSILSELASDTTTLVQDTLELIRAEIPEYGRADEEVTNSVRAMTEENARLWYQGLIDRKAPGSRELEGLAAQARQRVYQGIPLATMLQAFRVGGLAFWRTLLEAAAKNPAIQPEVLFELSPYALTHFDLVSRVVGDAYAKELGNKVQWRDRIKQELCQTVFSTNGEEGQFRSQANSLGLDPSGIYCAIALRLRRPADRLSPHEDLNRSFEELTRWLGTTAERIVDAVRHGHLLVWVPASAADPVTWERKTLTTAVTATLRKSGPVEGVGIGSTGTGVSGWRRSAEQALRALEIGARLPTKERIHRYEDLALYDVAARTPELADFLRSSLERLAANPDLLPSLEAYFEHGRQIKAAAVALHVHPNTLTYRIGRIERLLGGSLADPDWSIRLQLALKLREFGTAPG